MRKYSLITLLATLSFLFIVLMVPITSQITAAAAGDKKLIYDEAGLLTQEQYNELNVMANQYSAKRETDFIIITTKNPNNVDIELLTENFYDNEAPGYDKAHGNAAILTLDMRNRDVYLAGFYEAKIYFDDKRLDKIGHKIKPYLTSGDYALAFELYLETAHNYMAYKPGVNPDNPLFNGWVQLAIALVVGGVVVGVMAYNSGGRVTVHRHTYEDASTSGVLDRRDQYIRTTVTKRKIEKSSGGGGGGFGGGGGMTRGGHSHSGSRGKF